MITVFPEDDEPLEDRERNCDKCFDIFPESKLTHVGKMDDGVLLDQWYCDQCFEELTGLIRRRYQ